MLFVLTDFTFSFQHASCWGQLVAAEKELAAKLPDSKLEWEAPHHVLPPWIKSALCFQLLPNNSSED
jgi:hypothetical protein